MPNTNDPQTEVKTDLFGITIRLLVSGVGVLVIVYAWTDLKVTTQEERSKIAKDAGSMLKKAAKETLPIAGRMVADYFKSQTK